MRTVFSAALGVHVSALGFGCASLGSRVSTAKGRRALDMAFERGVTWYDVAPPYGDGGAEDRLGRFIQNRRDRVIVCTKFGIARPNISRLKLLFRPAARSLVAIFPKVRATISRARNTGAHSAIDPETIEPSVIDSLRRLRTDYIDVLALHEPTATEAAEERIFEVLERLRDNGFIRTISIAGAPTSIEAAIRASRPVAFAQFPDDPFADCAQKLRASIPPDVRPFFVTHGVFGSGVIERLERMPKVKQAALDALAATSMYDARTLAPDFLLTFAFSNNPDGVVITSMFSDEHIDRNCAVAAKLASPDFADCLRRIIKAGEDHA